MDNTLTQLIQELFDVHAALAAAKREIERLKAEGNKEK